MPRFHEQVRLAQQSLEKVAEKHYPSTRKVKRTGPVYPLVWTKALELAGGDVKRLEILDRFTVLVKNR